MRTARGPRERKRRIVWPLLTAVSAAGTCARTRWAGTASSKASCAASTWTESPSSAARAAASSGVRATKLGVLRDLPATKRVKETQVAVARTPASTSAYSTLPKTPPMAAL